MKDEKEIRKDEKQGNTPAEVPTAKEVKPEPKPASPAPQELDDKQLDKVAGGMRRDLKHNKVKVLIESPLACYNNLDC